MSASGLKDQAEKQKTTRIILSHGDKGGVGKSMIAAAVADYLNCTGEQVVVIDADTRNPDVARMLSKDMTCAQMDLRAENGWMEAMDFIERHQGYTIVISTPAGIGESMGDDIPRFAAFLNELGTPVEMELWWTINLLPDAVNLLGDAYKNYGKYFTRIRVVRNLFHSMGDTKAFIFWDESTLRPKLEKNGGLTINFPALHLRVMSKLFNPDRIMPFSHAIDASVGETVGLTSSERFKLKDWFKAVGVCLAPALNSDPD